MEKFTTRVREVEAMKLTYHNLKEASVLSGAWLDADEKTNEPYIILDVPNGQIVGKAGMWLVKLDERYLLMTDKNFQRKYEPEKEMNFNEVAVLISDPFVPPYDR